MAQVLEADETRLRAVCKARLKVLGPSSTVHDATAAELQQAVGAINYLSSLKEVACTEEQVMRPQRASPPPPPLNALARSPLAAQPHRARARPPQLGAEEYEAALGVEVIEGTLKTLKARTKEAQHLRFGWHSAVGAHKIAEALASPELGPLTAQLHEAQAAVEATESLKREQGVLESNVAKLRGKLAVLATLRAAVASGLSGREMSAEIDRYLSHSRLTQLRLSMKAAE